MALRFRYARKKDLASLDLIRETKLHQLHIDRITNQKKGNGEYILAFDKRSPVGHVFIDFKSPYEWHNCPIIVDLYVKDNERNKGFARKIMKYAEKRVKLKKYSLMGLDVETHEKWIRKFYEKIGYSFINGPHKLVYILKDKNNKKVVERVNHFQKRI